MDIQGYPDYLIYDDGRVWSKPRKNTIGHQRKGRFLKHRKTIGGYHNIELCKDGEKKASLVSRLVALHYIPNPENKPEVDHIDRDKDNNHVSNLRWATRRENCDNKGMVKTNKSGHKYICYNKTMERWAFQYRGNGNKIRKYFKTLDEAIAFKGEYLSS